MLHTPKGRALSVVGVLAAAFLATEIGVLAGDPAGPGTPPGSTSSYTLEDIHDRLESEAAGTQSTFTEPDAGPATGTMHTLNEIMGQAPVADNAAGATTGNVLAGRTFWGLNALSGQWGPQTGTSAGAPASNPAPACWDNTNRYVDCGNGTVTDTVTNLQWLKNADCYGSLNYSAANAAAGLAHGACGLTDNSTAGDWRLPTKVEWEETIARAAVLGCDSVPNGEISLTNTPGTGCYGAGPQPFTGVQSGGYWSATAIEDGPSIAWDVSLLNGLVLNVLKTAAIYVWPVRAGH